MQAKTCKGIVTQGEDRIIPDLDYWLDFFDLNEDAEDHAAQIRAAGMASTFLRPDWSMQITPYLLDGALVERQSAHFKLLYETILRLPELLCSGDKVAFAKRAGFCTADMLNLIRQTDMEGGLLPCRWDILACNGQWRAMEANFGGALGGLPSDPIHRIYDAIQHQEGVQKDCWHSASQMISNALRSLAADLKDPVYLVVDDAQQFATSRLTANSAAHMLGQALGCTVDAIAHTALAGFMSNTSRPVVTFELFTLRDMVDDNSYQFYLEQCGTGQIRRGVSLWCDLFMSKAVLAMLHEVCELDLVSDDVRKAIEQAVPKTTVITKGNIDTLRPLPRDDLVIKGAIGHGGTAVFCGWELSQHAWQDLLTDAANPDGKLGLCVMQNRVHGDPSTSISVTANGLWIESDAPQVLGVVQLDGAFCGGGVRQSIDNGGVVNAARMASVGVIRTTAQRITE